MSYGIHPFWFWNGDMDEKTIKEQIQQMADQKITGFVLCARQGLTIPYLSKTWFDRVGVAVDEAQKKDMLVWLYDEQPYPSGISGGKVVLDYPEFEAKHLVPHIITRQIDLEEESLTIDLEWGKPLYAKVFKLRHTEDPIDFEQGQDVLMNIGSLFREELYHEVGLTAYNQKRFLACDAYQQLDLKLAKGLYKIVIFMELPVRGHKYYDYFVDPLNPRAVDYFLETTHELYAKYLGEFFGNTIQGFFTDEIHPTGYEDRDIPWSPLMPQIYKEATGRDLIEDLPALIFDIHEHAQTIRHDFYESMVEGFIASYDQKILEWCHNHQLKYIGEKPILRSHKLNFMDIPGIDAGHQKVGTRPDMFSQRYRANGKIAASAAYLYRKEGALCESFHSIGWGMEIQDMKWTYDWLFLQGITLFVNHAYYGNAQGLTKHDAPPSGFFQMPWYQHQKILSEYVHTIGSRMHGGHRPIQIILIDPMTRTWSLTTRQERRQRLEEFESLQKQLFQAGFDFYIMDPSLLEKCTETPEGLQYGDDTFRLVVHPDQKDVENIIHKCVALKIPRLHILCENGPLEGVYAITWDKDGKSYHFIVNTGDFQGEIEVLNQDNLSLYKLHLQAFESVLAEDGIVKQDYVFESKHTWVFDLEQEGRFSLKGKNVLRMDRWQLTIGSQSHLVSAKPIIDQLEEGNFMLPVKRHDQFGTSKQMLFSELKAIYTAEFILKTQTDIMLRIEKKGIRGPWYMRINGERIEARDIVQEEYFSYEGYEIDISSYLRQGSNYLEIYVKANYSWEGLLTPIYLVGDFAVRSKNDKNILEPLGQVGRIGDYQRMGLPNYAGDISYQFVCKSLKEIHCFRVDDPRFQQSVRLRINGKDLGVKAFAPYIWSVKDIWKDGENEVEIIASTTRLGYYENQYYQANSAPHEAYHVYERK